MRHLRIPPVFALAACLMLSGVGTVTHDEVGIAPAAAYTMEVSAMFTELSTPGSAHPAAIVLVANGIIRATTGDLSFSVLADRAGTGDGGAAKDSLAA